MNIMFLFYKPIIPSTGGVQRVTHTLAKELIRHGHDIIFVSMTDKDKINNGDIIAPQYHLELTGRTEEDIEEDIKTIICKHKTTHAICQTLDKAYLFKHFPKQIKKIAVCHVQPFSYMGISRKRIWNTNTQNMRQLLFKTATLITPKIHERFFYRFEKKSLEDANKYADKICFISERFFPRIKKHMPTLPQDKFVAINNPNTYDVSSIELPQNKENIILWVGRVENAQKNAIGFIRMWQQLSTQAKDWRAIMVGDGSNMPYIQNYVKKNRIERIEFTGERKDTETFYKKAKYIAVTSFGESWCLVLTEAMSYGCVPIVYNTYETLHDIVDDKINGFIIQEPSPKLMASCLINQINNESDYQRISYAARKKVIQFSADRITCSWEQMLNNM